MKLGDISIEDLHKMTRCVTIDHPETLFLYDISAHMVALTGDMANHIDSTDLGGQNKYLLTNLQGVHEELRRRALVNGNLREHKSLSSDYYLA